MLDDQRDVTADEARELLFAIGFDERQAERPGFARILAFISASALREQRYEAEIAAAYVAAGRACVDNLIAIGTADKRDYAEGQRAASDGLGMTIVALTPAAAKAALDAMLEEAREEAVAQYHDKTNALLAKRTEEIRRARASGRADAFEEAASECENAATFDSAKRPGDSRYLDGFVDAAESCAARISALAAKWKGT